MDILIGQFLHESLRSRFDLISILPSKWNSRNSTPNNISSNNTSNNALYCPHLSNPYLNPFCNFLLGKSICNLPLLDSTWSIPASGRSKASVCGRSLAVIAGSNPAVEHGCLSFVNVVFCKAEVSAMGRSLAQRSCIECVSLSVIRCTNKPLYLE